MSIILFTYFVNGKGEHGSESFCYCFNLDLLNNRLIGYEELFDSAGVLSLCRYLGKNLEALTDDNLFSEDARSLHPSDCSWDFKARSSGRVSYVGKSIDTANLVLFYRVNAGSAVSLQEVRIPFTDAKQFVTKEYRWIFEQAK